VLALSFFNKIKRKAKYLIRLLRFWVKWDKLKPVDFEQAAKHIRYGKDEKLHGAYRKILELYDCRDLTHWKEELCAQQVDDEQHLLLEVRPDAKPEKRKRVSGNDSSNLREWRYREDDGQECEVWMPKFKKLIVDECVSGADSDALFADRGLPPPRKDSENRKQMRLGDFSRSSTEAGSDFRRTNVR
jgi:hypothetical protein